MKTNLCFLAEDGETICVLPLRVDHWEACNIGNTLLAREIVNADEFHVTEEEEEE
ncbi:hypothetical protein [Maritalea mediterranea]|uniref:Uncharacterized protein n=1 Tax=Maritalea mediterranea TaxID=2909667 RepID=A0ABS9E6Z3_9HYPH|nr:hypothetical protein [Maritalea mediterranea]MCF4098597.1 hypothetical protein [Maritalea mediterranea]